MLPRERFFSLFPTIQRYINIDGWMQFLTCRAHPACPSWGPLAAVRTARTLAMRMLKLQQAPGVFKVYLAQHIVRQEQAVDGPSALSWCAGSHAVGEILVIGFEEAVMKPIHF